MYIELDEDDSILGEIGKIKWANISKKIYSFLFSSDGRDSVTSC